MSISFQQNKAKGFRENQPSRTPDEVIIRFQPACLRYNTRENLSLKYIQAQITTIRLYDELAVDPFPLNLLSEKNETKLCECKELVGTVVKYTQAPFQASIDAASPAYDEVVLFSIVQDKACFKITRS